MLDENLKHELTREMTSGDLCNTRILKYMPLLERETCRYMVEENIYNYNQAFLDIIKSWCEERIKDISQKFNYYEKINSAIREICDFYDVICTMYNDYNNNTFKNIIEYYIMVQNIYIKNYTDIVKLCNYSLSPLNSKLQKRVRTFKNKFKKVSDGQIPIKSFYQYEIIPQKEQMDIAIKRLKQFTPEQFPIFVICYDLRRILGIAKII